jgi:hypothetical protein
MKKWKITIIIRQPLERLPPIINLIDCLNVLEYNINLICTGVSSRIIDKYSNIVNFEIIKISNYRIPILGKIYNWLSFREKVFLLLKKNPDYYKKSIVWVASADAAVALGKKLFDFDYVFQCHELYDAFPVYRKKLKNIMQNARININPEDNRGAIYRSWYNLKDTPVTLPNKPLYHPQKKKMPITDNVASQIIEKIKNKKIIIYQGGIVKDRDVTSIAEAIEKMNNDWVLVLMGNTDKTSYLEDLLKKYPGIIYIPPIPAPLHLEVTSWARIGIVSYSFVDLNHTFCAPNKTWEYSGFDIPMLGNSVPGIMNDMKRFGSGEVVNLENVKVNEIIDVINKIDSNYDYYSHGARSFYESVDIGVIISSILEKLKYYLHEKQVD